MHAVALWDEPRPPEGGKLQDKPASRRHILGLRASPLWLHLGRAFDHMRAASLSAFCGRRTLHLLVFGTRGKSRSPDYKLQVQQRSTFKHSNFLIGDFLFFTGKSNCFKCCLHSSYSLTSGFVRYCFGVFVD